MVKLALGALLTGGGGGGAMVETAPKVRKRASSGAGAAVLDCRAAMPTAPGACSAAVESEAVAVHSAGSTRPANQTLAFNTVGKVPTAWIRRCRRSVPEVKVNRSRVADASTTSFRRSSTTGTPLAGMTTAARYAFP